MPGTAEAERLSAGKLARIAEEQRRNGNHDAGAQAYLTGEIRHHEIIDAVARGLVVFDAGHYASEVPMIPRLIRFLKEQLGDTVDLIASSQQPFTGALY